MTSFYKNNYIRGDYFVICDICGSKVRSSTTRMQWNNMRVCASEWNAKPLELRPQQSLPHEGRPVKNSRPPPTTDTYIDETALPNVDDL